MKKYLALTIICIPIFAFAKTTIDRTNLNVISNAGLTYWQTFDGNKTLNGGLIDSSSSNLNGSFINISTSTFYVQGKIGQGIKFDANSPPYIDLGTNAVFSGAGTRSISMWINHAATSSAGYLFTAYDGAGNSSGKRIVVNSGGTVTISWQTAGGGPVTTTGISGSLATSTWNMLTVIFDSTTGNGSIYINGVFKISGALGTETTNSSKYRICGRWVTANVGSAVLCQITIDDFRIYSRVLTQTEITQLYDMGRSTIKSSLGTTRIKSNL